MFVVYQYHSDYTSKNLPSILHEKFTVYERNHASAILKTDFPEEYLQVISILSNFTLTKEDILKPGGRKSPISEKLDSQFYNLGWKEKKFETVVKVDDVSYPTPTHKIDCFKNRIGLEIEWNNKDPFYDRDLNNFRILHELNALSVGIIVTRSESLQTVFNDLGKGSSYGSSTTHNGKLRPRIDGKGAGGCPVLVFAINPETVQL